MTAQPDLRLVPDAPAPREPPRSIDAEQGLLGAVLLRDDVLDTVKGFLTAEHFSEEIHRVIYAACAQMREAGKRATPITIRPFLPEIAIAGTTMSQYLARLAADATTLINAEHYAWLIYDLAKRRDMIGIGEHLLETAYMATIGTNAASVAYSVVAELQELAATANPSSTRLDLGAASDELLTRAAAIMRNEETQIALSTGLADLDRVMGGGYRPGTLVIIAGRPGQGKTALMTSGSRRCAAKGTACMAFSFEVDRSEILARHLTDLAYRPRNPITYQHVLRGRGLTEEDLWCLEDARKRLAELPLCIDVASGLTLAEIGARVRAEKLRMASRGQELRVVFIDHLRFIKSENRYAGNANKETGEKSRGLKQLAKDENMCIVLLSQLSRETERREDKRPTLSDLRDSGELEEDADVVIFLYREHYYLVKKPGVRQSVQADIDAAEAARFKCELIVDKNRAGPVTTVHLWCDVTASTMADAQQQTEGRLW